MTGGPSKPLRIVPVSFAAAAEFVKHWHRHHQPPVGHKFSIGLALDGELVGVAMVGRPIARRLDNGLTLEVNRTCVADDVPNGNSMLYGAAWRATKALGYTRLITYTQSVAMVGPTCEDCCHDSCRLIRKGGETGASLRGAGWRVVAELSARPGWDMPSRMRLPLGTENVQRTLWEAS